MNLFPHSKIPALHKPAALLLCGALVLLSGCASPDHRAPVEDRKPPSTRPAPVLTPGAATPAAASASAPGASPADAAASKPPPGIENAGKPGYYSVKPGDTLIRVGLDNGQNWRDIARWNGLDNPNIIEVGQVLRVIPPAPVVDPNAVSTRPVAQAGRVDSRPLDAKPPQAGASAPLPVASGASAVAAAPAAPAREPDEDLSWAWPAAGPVATPFDDNKSKGLAITGKAGDPVFAAADGRVVYAGAGLRGYGNLIIVKHNNTYLTAYAHNQTLLVKEEQVVRRGQKIAEMGNSDAERVQLHFEIRRQGKPIDPARLLPARP
jgi:lipoprotein NlpD